MTVADFERMFDLWRAGDENAAAAFFAEDGVFHEPGKEPVTGRTEIAAHWKPFFHGGPEWRMIVHDLFGDGDRFAVVYDFDVKVKDAWMPGFGCAIVKMRDGKIAEWREFKG